ncbi:CAP domain-containing protein [Corynebacterium sp. ES2775-CONJ]|uniref:CAP domain-containing protein n=1 Tax=Corynebacterium sp. ES2775-CONJ TaxID=2974029 RepID=UPI00216910A1|nr:CAP domain-containing protein [Corynebacterium sp. ES2775-CONJ]MCS4490392.1 CAP domain-containing protein [Corynebacterium sp. ES2775-CONJ]
MKNMTNKVKRRIVAVTTALAVTSGVVAAPQAIAAPSNNSANGQNVSKGQGPETQVISIIGAILGVSVLAAFLAAILSQSKDNAALSSEIIKDIGDNIPQGNTPAPAPTPQPRPNPRPAPTHDPAPAPTPTPWDKPNDPYMKESELREEALRQFDEWNRYRRMNGLPEVIWDHRMEQDCYRWADKLGRFATPEGPHGNKLINQNVKFAHESPYIESGLDPEYAELVMKVSPDRYFAENTLATFYGDFQKALEKFKASPGHNRNLLRGKGTGQPRGAVSIVRSSFDGIYGMRQYVVIYRIKE